MTAHFTVHDENDKCLCVSQCHWLFVSVCVSLVNIANSQEWTLNRSVPELRLVRSASHLLLTAEHAYQKLQNLVHPFLIVTFY